MKFITNLLFVSRLRSVEPYLHFPFAFIKCRESLSFTFPYLAVYGISVTKSNRIIPFREMTSVCCEDNRKCVIALGVKMWIFLMFGFVAQNKYPLTPLGKNLGIDTSSSYFIYWIRYSSTYKMYVEYKVFRRFLTSFCQFCFLVLYIGWISMNVFALFSLASGANFTLW